MRKLACFLWLGTSQRYLETMTGLYDCSPRDGWKKSTSSTAHSWRLSSTCASGVVPFQRQDVLSSVPLALASRFQTMRIGSANTSVALIWNFRRSRNLTARILEARTCGPNEDGRSEKNAGRRGASLRRERGKP